LLTRDERPEPLLCLECIVCAAAELQVRGIGRSTLGKRDEVVKLEKAALRATR
jgi:hypothetical protein